MEDTVGLDDVFVARAQWQRPCHGRILWHAAAEERRHYGIIVELEISLALF